MNRVRAPEGHKDILYGEAPYGWKISGDRSRIVVDDSEQRVLGIVRHMYYVQRLSMRAIVDELSAMGVVNRRGRAFGLFRVYEIVHSFGRKVRPPGRPRARSVS